MLGDIDRDIRTAYLQLALVGILALLRLIAGERLIIRPIKVLTDMTNRFGKGDLSARASKAALPVNSSRSLMHSTRWLRSCPNVNAR